MRVMLGMILGAAFHTFESQKQCKVFTAKIRQRRLVLTCLAWQLAPLVGSSRLWREALSGCHPQPLTGAVEDAAEEENDEHHLRHLLLAGAFLGLALGLQAWLWVCGMMLVIWKMQGVHCKTRGRLARKHFPRRSSSRGDTFLHRCGERVCTRRCSMSMVT